MSATVAMQYVAPRLAITLLAGQVALGSPLVYVVFSVVVSVPVALAEPAMFPCERSAYVSSVVVWSRAARALAWMMATPSCGVRPVQWKWMNFDPLASGSTPRGVVPLVGNDSVLPVRCVPVVLSDTVQL